MNRPAPRVAPSPRPAVIGSLFCQRSSPGPVTLAFLALAAAACAPETRSKAVDFEVSEGTSLAFDISPDGETSSIPGVGGLPSSSPVSGWKPPYFASLADTRRTHRLSPGSGFSRYAARRIGPEVRPDAPWAVRPDQVV